LLEEILSFLPAQLTDPALLVGLETKDDAIVYRIDEDKAVVATTDFFMPVVDDPHDFGAIAAANALSDVYAVGGKPIFALAIAGMPTGNIPTEMIAQILAGGADMAAKAGIIVGGGHSIDSPEPIYGLAVIGLVHPDKVKRNSAAQAGDALILGKGLGIGILSNAFKRGELSDADYAQMIASTTKLNSIGADLADYDGVHAMTDVTGFGLMGHLMEMSEGSGLGALVNLASVPFLGSAIPFAQAGLNTGAGTRNREAFGGQVTLPDGLPDWQRNLLFDPQTSGGLLVSVAQDQAAEVLALFHAQGYDEAAIVGEVVAGVPQVSVQGGLATPR
jgi:selenide, water dikinase